MTGSGYVKNVRGFTLLELLVVLAIAGLLMAAVPPLISAVIPGAELKGATRGLAVSLREARFDAISRGVPVDVVFVADPAAYTIANEQARSLPRNAMLRVSNLSSSTAREPAYPVAMTEPFRLRFFPDGSSSGANILLSRGKHSYSISIGWLMSRITISRDDGSDS